MNQYMTGRLIIVKQFFGVGTPIDLPERAPNALLAYKGYVPMRFAPILLNGRSRPSFAVDQTAG
jgi:hypothetical protein